MNIKDLSIGQTAELSKKFTSYEVGIFSSLSLDVNPIHLDSEYAKATIFKKNIVHGFLVGSLISAVIATKLPGEGAIYLHQELNFRKPVYHNETITAKVEILDINYNKSILFLSTLCLNCRNEIVIDGEAVIKIL